MVMSACKGTNPLTTKVDEPMKSFVDSRSDEYGLSRSELLRRVLELYLRCEQEEMLCPACNEQITVEFR